MVNNDVNKVDGTIGSKIQYAVFSDQNLTKAQIKDWLARDMRGVYLLLAELLASVEAQEALAEVFWKRYRKFHDERAANPQLFDKPGTK